MTIAPSAIPYAALNIEPVPHVYAIDDEGKGLVYVAETQTTILSKYTLSALREALMNDWKIHDRESRQNDIKYSVPPAAYNRTWVAKGTPRELLDTERGELQSLFGSTKT
ncbi:MAG: hypothetical protein HOO67_00490 [Candidatus Peribacteraceae bacterium]|nr:hypothetical protein [Candidatus Peribacteraceae bacterium]